jgi:orotate phosphoribosyltransferase
VREVIDAVRERGAEVVGVGMLVDRTNGGVDFGVPFYACISLSIESWAPEDCQLCKQGIELKIT